MSDEAVLTQSFGKSRSRHGLSRFPIAQTAFAFKLNSLIAVSHRLSHFKTSEQALFQDMVEDLVPTDLLIGDRHLAGANYYAHYQDKGLEFITPAHQRLRIDRLKILKKFGEKDRLLKLPIGKKHRQKDASLPEYVVVRAVEVTVKIRGKKKSFWLMTSLKDPKKYSACEIKELYKKRWRVETLIGEIKHWLGMDVLRSKTEEGIHKEFTARILAFNLIHWSILKAAKKHNKKPKRVSTSAALRLVVSYSLKMSTAPAWFLQPLYEKMLEMIAYSEIRCRPNRLEPRLKKRDQKHYPILKITRTEWRRINDFAA